MKFNKYDRVVVKSGPHAGRHGKVVVLPGETEILDEMLDLDVGKVRVALDAGEGRTVPVTLESQDLEHE